MVLDYSYDTGESSLQHKQRLCAEMYFVYPLSKFRPSLLRQDPTPPWFEFLVSFYFFAPWYGGSREASSVKIS